jgi:hypothetical protein
MKNIFLVLLIAITFISCERGDSDFLGGSLNDQFGELLVLDSLKSNTSNFNFSHTSPRFFEAQWSKNLNWNLTVVGTQTGASKTFSGYSNKLDFDNTSWNGTSDDFPSFTQESCEATLTLSDNDTSLEMSTTVNIDALKPLQDGLKVIADFEDGFPLNTLPLVQAGAKLVITEDSAAVGSKYLHMGGYVPYDYLLTSIKIPVQEMDMFSSTSPLLLYFNMATIGGMVGEVPANQFLKIIIREGDGATLANGEKYSAEINPVNWSDWQLFSLPYSDFVLESASVNNLREPGRINQIEIMCLSCPAEEAPDGPTCPENMNLNVNTDIDFIAFTENESYKP